MVHRKFVGGITSAVHWSLSRLAFLDVFKIMPLPRNISADTLGNIGVTGSIMS